MIRSFLLGAVAGGVAVWVWREQIRGFLDQKTRTVRSRAADGLQSVEETAERLLDRTATPLRRAEEMLDDTKARIGETLRAGQEAIRPSPPSDAPE